MAIFDLFVSYRRLGAARVRPLVERLRRLAASRTRFVTTPDVESGFSATAWP